LDQGNLCYIVCASIEGENSSARNVKELTENLNEHYRGRYAIDGIHSKVEAERQEAIMQDFKEKKINILVCTSIIEVGIDIVDANILIVYNAERFGLSQLHQLRCRIGRQAKPGFCYLLSDSQDEEVSERLQFLAANNDGAKIALYDFFRRGFGELTGVKQSGRQYYGLIDFQGDLQLLEDSRNDAESYLENAKTDDPLLLKYLNESIIINN